MYKIFKHGITYFCLQASATQHINNTRNLTIQLGQQLNTRITNVSVSFMNTQYRTSCLTFSAIINMSKCT